MLGTLIGIIIALIVIGVVYWCIQQLLPLIPLPPPFRQIINVLLVLVLVLVVLYIIVALLGAAGVSVPVFGRL